MVRFLHTADLQLGKPFEAVPGDSGARLRELRFEVIDRIGSVARERGVDFVLVAGDVFDANTVHERVVAQACSRLGRFPCPVFLLPGNHDCLDGPTSVFRTPAFVRQQPDQVHVLGDFEPRSVAEGKAVLFPAPLLRRRSTGDTTSHFSRELGRDKFSQAVRIGVAHGSVVGFEGQDGEATNSIAPDRAQQAELDYLALGDWHGTFQVDDRTWYSGTPEPTHHKDNDQGNLLFVEVEATGSLPRVERLPIARTTWLRHSAELASDEDIASIGRWFDALDRPEDTLVRLELRGHLSLEGQTRLDGLLQHHGARLLDLRLRGPGTVLEATDAELDRLGGQGYLRDVVQRLRSTVRAEGEDAAVAAAALQLLHQLRSEMDDGC